MKRFLVLCLFCVVFVENVTEGKNCGLEPDFQTNGDLNLVVIVNECPGSGKSLLVNSIIQISAWVCDRLNVLNIFQPLKIGASVYNVCEDKHMIDPLVQLAKSEKFSLGAIVWNPVPSKVIALGNALDIQITVVRKQWRSLITAAIKFLSVLRFNDNISIITDEPDILTVFYHESRKEWICVKSVKSFRDKYELDESEGTTIIFGYNNEINSFLKKFSQFPSINILIFIPLDGSQFEGLPDNSYIFQPLYTNSQQFPSKTPKITPSPILLDIANPIIQTTKYFLNNCTTTTNNCLNNSKQIEQREILEFLKIEPLFDKFLYNIYKIENLALITNEFDLNSTFDQPETVLQTQIKIGVFYLFNNSLVLENFDYNLTNLTDTCFVDHICVDCLNFNSYQSDSDYLLYNIVLKQEPWILAVLAVATVGILFCIAILIFIFVRLCKRDIFEGNPVLSVLLLLSVSVLYASVVPFSLEVTFESDFKSGLSNYLCLSRSLAVTLTYSCVFSLILSRCVMLATVAYEAGFMSHITGHVQSLLCLFMIAVQGALSLQSVENCHGLQISNSFLYSLSYNFLLLCLLLCVCPFVYRSQRNYKEGFYFSLAIFLVLICWMVWVSVYVLVEENWKNVAVCCGLLGTASAILGAVFIPRTYLMTSAVVRDSLTGALPSLAFASSNSVLDLNYTNTNQHVYDCVNIATINANVSGPMPQCNPNFYSDEPNLETSEINANSLLPGDGSDKVTRF